MIGFEGQASEATTIPNKPTPTGFKAWCCANQGFLWSWIWHIPGEGNGPVGIKTPTALGGTKRDGNRGNKTQAAALALLERLPGKGYQVLWTICLQVQSFLSCLEQGVMVQLAHAGRMLG
jgi:hypothetical protein